MVKSSSPSSPESSHETAQDDNHDKQTIPSSHGKVKFSDDLLGKTNFTTKVRKDSNSSSNDTKMSDSVINTEELDDSSVHSTSSSALEHIDTDIEESTNEWKQVPEKKTKSY